MFIAQYNLSNGFIVKEIGKLHLWFEENKRSFPWREERTPYKVWVSEVMLQQTRASVVIAYFNRWMELFPTIQKLAEACSDSVMKAWEGLGYYSRARQLHEGAKDICFRFGGKIPSCREDLASIRGIGPYTMGAILSFGFSQRAPAVDGNVMRVLSRYFLIEENISRAPVRRLLEKKAEELLDVKEPWISAEALIELGATVCSRSPQCMECPLRSGCLGFSSKKAEALPVKNSPPETIYLFRRVVIIEFEGSFLVKKEEIGKVMAGLYEFPYFEMEENREGSLGLVREVKKNLGIKTEFVRHLGVVKHTFTRYKAKLYPAWVRAAEKKSLEGWQWISREKLPGLSFSSGHRKIMQKIILDWEK